MTFAIVESRIEAVAAAFQFHFPPNGSSAGLHVFAGDSTVPFSPLLIDWRSHSIVKPQFVGFNFVQLICRRKKGPRAGGLTLNHSEAVPSNKHCKDKTVEEQPRIRKEIT
eukprot:CAMPEP_0194071008 /NCGR_PEP_ID=MMETSP0009_2-20130614/88480_1 /TAXON_ID=210454 /ORGANISM="Grammatophora oceanica, Strain CCMP 410" /LENGTH=109 /DNA_ID=CAMNT_0038724301 /DNA_START=309 /DNA_END=638 /DNA_ORIENTATION=-